jgi:hypothetical protein
MAQEIEYPNDRTVEGRMGVQRVDSQELLKSELVEKRRWISGNWFLQAVHVCVLEPGPKQSSREQSMRLI